MTAAPSTRRRRTAPHLASDTLRGYVVLAVMVVASFTTPFALVVLVDGIERDLVVPVTLFVVWTVMAGAAAVLQVAVFWRASAPELVRWLRATEPEGRLRRLAWAVQGGGAISWAVTGSGVALAAVVALRFDEGLRSDPLAAGAGIAVVLASFAMIVTSFAVRYARQHALDRGLGFPGEREPRFGEFLYLAVQVAVTFGGSDVEVRSSRMRGLVGIQALISFLFNTVVLALLVSLFVA